MSQNWWKSWTISSHSESSHISLIVTPSLSRVRMFDLSFNELVFKNHQERKKFQYTRRFMNTSRVFGSSTYSICICILSFWICIVFFLVNDKDNLIEGRFTDICTDIQYRHFLRWSLCPRNQNIQFFTDIMQMICLCSPLSQHFTLNVDRVL